MVWEIWQNLFFDFICIALGVPIGGRPSTPKCDKQTTHMTIQLSRKPRRLIKELNEHTETHAAAALFSAARKLPAIRLKTILATTDFSEAAMEGVRFARSFAERF